MKPQQPEQHKLVQAMMMTMDAPAEKLRADDSRNVEVNEIQTLFEGIREKIQRS